MTWPERATLVGRGRLGSALRRALAAEGVATTFVGGRAAEQQSAGRQVAEQTATADLVVLSVPDDAIAAVASRLAPLLPHGTTVVHCSGALGTDALQSCADRGLPTGAWHPMQAFASVASPLQSGIGWGITAEPDPAARLAELSRRLGGHPFVVRPEDRARYHAAAAMASNYTDVLVHHATLLLEDCGLDPADALRVLLPLVRTSLDGLELAGLPDGLTGPLARGDVGTIRRHLAALADRPETERFYRAAGLAAMPLLRERGLDAATRHELGTILGEDPGDGS
ncbi:Predicted oxidoreductase, contains short-chain dehydrogenase (SDR) and DUF2520 domains [Raineyella antarctica]|uniref:Predicted oxidoreductase, contains short-chain dehydrogenase (SDR) and DUF2520 domains n=1 Tax=Raineyella antarctica TaxID=1577474 RepID=A0A1G6GE49_9ACTN|nr:DUF2520 domain-containing protein [Raineyella antarctica]SDB80025.1 Predicted oxidoreductase, contains short-chain dehydrogenase (SDR) and DUF2520 domains [Raineyella antarctica]